MIAINLDSIQIYWQNLSTKGQKIVLGFSISILFSIFIFSWLILSLVKSYQLTNQLEQQNRTFFWMKESSYKIINNGLDDKDLESRVASVFVGNDINNDMQIISINKNQVDARGEYVSFSNFYKALLYLENKWKATIMKIDVKYVEPDRISVRLSITR